MPRLVLSNKADNDLEGIFEYGVLNFGANQAKQYLLGINEKFQSIADNKDLGRSRR